MLVLCDNCGKGITVPDEKVPPGRRFAFNCPACQHKIKVEPDDEAPITPSPADTESSFSDLDDSSEVAPPAPATTVPMTAAPMASGPAPTGATVLPPLRAQEQQLFTLLSPTALVIDHGVPPDPALAGELHALGFDDPRNAESVEKAVEVASETEVGLLMLRVQKASAPPFEPLAPLGLLSPATRRRTFVALVADNVQSLDGQVAFLLQVNCLLSNRDRPKHPAMLRRALLHHLKLYQHWAIEQM